MSFVVRHGIVLSCLLAVGVMLGDCTRTPAPDAMASGPTVDDIVQRLKCDIYGAFVDRLNAPYGYEWLHFWTAQTSLNLIVNDQSQIAPGVVFTSPLRAVTVPGVVTNFSQSFNMGLGAQWSNTATRNKSITFTVSLDELKAEFETRPHNCHFPDSIDLQSDLGIGEWIDASLSPVEHGFLNPGYHKAPKTGAAAASAKATLNKELPPTYKNNSTVQGPDCLPPKRPVVSRNQLDFDLVFCDLAEVNSLDLTQLDGPQVRFLAKTVSDIHALIRVVIRQRDQSRSAADRKAKQEFIDGLENDALALAVFVDPPIDTLSRQVQFIIVWGASANPGWTLLKFKGPNPASGSMLSGSETKTHTLNVVLGPPSSPDLQNASYALQIGTAVSNSINTAPPIPH